MHTGEKLQGMTKKKKEARKIADLRKNLMLEYDNLVTFKIALDRIRGLNPLFTTTKYSH